MPQVANTLDELRSLLEKGSQKAVIDFWATWCGPCRAIAPIYEQLSNEYDDITFIKVDVDAAEDIAQEYGVRSMPTFILFFGGEKFTEVIGANPQALKTAIAQLAEK